jgi:hypothetical protein
VINFDGDREGDGDEEDEDIRETERERERCRWMESWLLLMMVVGWDVLLERDGMDGCGGAESDGLKGVTLESCNGGGDFFQTVVQKKQARSPYY